VSNPYDTGRFADVFRDDLAAVDTAEDVAHIVELMLDDLRRDPQAWENATLDRFLDALAACLTHTPPTPGQPGPAPTWRLLAETLVKATGYE
jgi:hypothetical protein